MAPTIDDGDDDVWTDEDLLDLGMLGADLDSGGSTPSRAGGGNHQYSIDPTALGFPVGGFQVDLGDDQVSHWGTSNVARQFDQAAQSYIPHIKKKRGPKALAKVTVDDFEEGPEQSAFQVIMHHAHKLLDKNRTDKAFKEALHWFFTGVDDGDLTFDLCCEVLAARPDVIRLRIQYEWFKRGTSFTGPFDFLTVGAPRMMEGEILFHGGKIGFALAREIWVQPGISTVELLREVSLLEPTATLDSMRAALESLQERHILSLNTGWYFTGRNPMLMNMRAANVFSAETSVGGTVNWARLFAR